MKMSKLPSNKRWRQRQTRAHLVPGANVDTPLHPADQPPRRKPVTTPHYPNPDARGLQTADKTPNHVGTLSQTQSRLIELVRNLRKDANAIKNSAAARNMGQGMLTAAYVIEQQLIYRSTRTLIQDLSGEEAMAIAQMCKRFLYDDAVRFSDRHDGGAERDATLRAIAKLQSALADHGCAPR